MRPVTELYEAADVVATHGCDESRRADLMVAALAFEVEGCKPNTPMLEVLDLVATLPPERLGLVRWVAGLTASDCALLRWSLADGTCNAMARVLPEDSLRLRAMFSGLHVALSGGEGGKKCRECDGTGKVNRLEGSGSIRVVKYDPCPKCAEGAGGAKEERHAVNEQGDCAPWCRACLANTLARLYPDGTVKVAPAPTILPAGKPPPFLRVGMVLDNPEGGRWKVVGMGEENARAAVAHEKAGLGWAEVAELLTWPLAEPFTVEGES